jgi:threonine/homoserine/homoserine lactone efflux protein
VNVLLFPGRSRRAGSPACSPVSAQRQPTRTLSRGCIAGFSITFVIQFLLREEFWIRLIGGILLVLIGVFYYFKQPQSLSAQKQGVADESDYVSTLLLTLTNPTTVLSFLAILATLGMKEDKASWMTLLLVVGIFCGSMLWWIILVTIVNRLRDRIDDHTPCCG